VMPRDYTHTLAFGTPTVTPTIKVLRQTGFSFYAAVDDSVEATQTTWRYHRAYLQGHHLRVWWRPALQEAA
jgi:hypothetical protein